MPPSKGEINRAGGLLRTWHESADLGGKDLNDLEDAYRTLAEFRASFSYPLTKVTTGLRSMVSREADDVIVSQRLKREPQIINKLVRQPGMLLARIEDIGGCRAVLPSPDAVAGVEQRIRKRWEVKRYRDYVDEPKVGGYRAVHLVTERDGMRIEVQLRTKGQQEWADTVESFAGHYDLPLKDESGPAVVLDFFKRAGEGIYCDEYLVPVPDGFADRYREAAQAVRDWMQTNK